MIAIAFFRNFNQGQAGTPRASALTTIVAFFDSPEPFPYATPWRPERGRITVHHADKEHAVCVNDQPRTSFATPTLERVLSRPVTSRGADTVLRAASTARELG